MSDDALFVGWGEVARFTATGPGRFADADRWWRAFAERLDVRDEVGIAGTGPVAFASFTFADSSPGSVLVVPRVLVGRRDGRSWVTEFSDGDGPSAMRAVSPVRRSGTLRGSGFGLRSNLCGSLQRRFRRRHRCAIGQSQSESGSLRCCHDAGRRQPIAFGFPIWRMERTRGGEGRIGPAEPGEGG